MQFLIEEKVEEDPSLGKLSLAIFAETQVDECHPVKTFRLWGSRLNSAETPADEPKQDNNAANNFSADASPSQMVLLSFAWTSRIRIYVRILEIPLQEDTQFNRYY